MQRSKRWWAPSSPSRASRWPWAKQLFCRQLEGHRRRLRRCRPDHGLQHDGRARWKACRPSSTNARRAGASRLEAARGCWPAPSLRSVPRPARAEAGLAGATLQRGRAPSSTARQSGGLDQPDYREGPVRPPSRACTISPRAACPRSGLRRHGAAAGTARSSRRRCRGTRRRTARSPSTPDAALAQYRQLRGCWRYRPLLVRPAPGGTPAGAARGFGDLAADADVSDDAVGASRRHGLEPTA